MGRPDASLPRPTGVFLDPGFSASAGNLGPGLGVVGTLPFVQLIRDQRLVNQRMVHRHIEYSIVEVDRVNYLARLGFNRYFHKSCSGVLFRF